jgi:hypothetical protein
MNDAERDKGASDDDDPYFESATIVSSPSLPSTNAGKLAPETKAALAAAEAPGQKLRGDLASLSNRDV